MAPPEFQSNQKISPTGAGGTKKLLVIGHVWPEPKTTAAGNRMLQLLEAFLNRGHKVIFATTASKTDYSHDLTTMGITEASIQLNDSSFDSFIRELRPEIVLFDRFMVEEQFGWRVAENCPSVVRILNTEDLHSLRDYRESCHKKGLGFSSTGWLQQDKTKREIASILRSDLTLLISSFEMELLMDSVQIPSALLLHLPFLLDGIGTEAISNWPKFDDRIDFISFGNGRHTPNVDSFNYLKETIWPLIRAEIPDAQLHIYGAYLPQQTIVLHDTKEGFFVQGWAKDLEEKVRRAKVVLAPLRFGAGIKGKLTLAMQQGTPSVTTGIGAEGMLADNAWPGGIAEEPETFAKLAIALYQNEEVWQKTQKRGLELVNTFYDRKTLEPKFFKRLGAVQECLEDHRNKNIIGALLRHQYMAATKFMGKWIEEKNKKPRLKI